MGKLIPACETMPGDLVLHRSAYYRIKPNRESPIPGRVAAQYVPGGPRYTRAGIVTPPKGGVKASDTPAKMVSFMPHEKVLLVLSGGKQ